jgi:hypothetical protein
VLCIQDTTSLDFTNSRGDEELGHLEVPYCHGILVHPTIAVAPDGRCLGVMHARMWTRDRASIGIAKERNNRPIEDKESYRWLESFENVSALAKEHPDTKYISIGDRESDIYELCARASTPGEQAEIIIRAAWNRRTDAGHMVSTIAQAPMLGTCTVHVEHKNKRTAVVEVRAATVRITSPARLGGEPCTMQVLDVRETHAPRGITPLHWTLLTTLDISTMERAGSVIEYYRQRWTIETFFRILKQGCRVEEVQLETVKRLCACVAVFLLVAWRVQFLMTTGRAQPHLAATVLFTRAELNILSIVATNKRLRQTNLTLGAATRMIATLGGYCSNKLPPGVMILWRGMHRFLEAVSTATSLKQAI